MELKLEGCINSLGWFVEGDCRLEEGDWFNSIFFPSMNSFIVKCLVYKIWKCLRDTQVFRFLLLSAINIHSLPLFLPLLSPLPLFYLSSPCPCTPNLSFLGAGVLSTSSLCLHCSHQFLNSCGLFPLWWLWRLFLVENIWLI